MSKFKVGDLVRLKKDERNDFYRMYGRVFRVTAVEGDDIAINGGDLVWYGGRFEAAEKQDELPEVPVTISVKAVIDLLEDDNLYNDDIINYLNGYIDGAKGGNQ